MPPPRIYPPAFTEPSLSLSDVRPLPSSQPGFLRARKHLGGCEVVKRYPQREAAPLATSHPAPNRDREAGDS